MLAEKLQSLPPSDRSGERVRKLTNSSIQRSNSGNISPIGRRYLMENAIRRPEKRTRALRE